MLLDDTSVDAERPQHDHEAITTSNYLDMSPDDHIHREIINDSALMRKYLQVWAAYMFVCFLMMKIYET